ncbi:hypothetical protein Bca4012_024482 [Brassica carinata]
MLKRKIDVYETISSTPNIAVSKLWKTDNRLLLYDCSDDDAKLVLYNFRLNSYGIFFRESRYYLGNAVLISKACSLFAKLFTTFFYNITSYYPVPQLHVGSVVPYFQRNDLPLGQKIKMKS